MKALKFILSMMLLVFIFTACSQNNQKDSQSNGNQENGDSSSKKTVITWMQWWKSELGEDVLNEVKAAFEEEHPDIELKIEDLPFSQYHDKLINLNMADNAPDIFVMQPAWYREFIQIGLSAPLDKFYNDMPEEFRTGIEGPLWVESGGYHYGMPLFTGNIALFYNEDKFNEVQVAPPTTWEEVIEVSKKLTNTGNSQYAFTGNIGVEPPTPAQYEIWPLILQAGGSIVEDNRATFNSKEGVEALEFYKDLVKKYEITTPGELSAGEKEKRSNFSAENTAMMYEGPWGIAIQKQSNPELNFNVAPLPTNKTTGTFVGGGLLGISDNSPNKEAAWKFLSFMGGVEGQLLWAELGSYFPHNNQALEDPIITEDENLQVFSQQLKMENAIAVDMYLPEANNLKKIFLSEIQKFISDEKTAQEALDAAAEKWNETLEKYK